MVSPSAKYDAGFMAAVPEIIFQEKRVPVFPVLKAEIYWNKTTSRAKLLSIALL